MTPDPATLPLRDIHLPEGVGWWPPAPGWWLLLAAATLAAIFIVWRRRHVRGRRSVLSNARRRLRRIETGFARHGDETRLVRELSCFARALVMTVCGRRETAALTGTAWLACLDRWTDDAAFSRGPGHVLARGPYARNATNVDPEAILALFREWVPRVCRDRGLAGGV